jgi:hypothetical protein
MPSKLCNFSTKVLSGLAQPEILKDDVNVIAENEDCLATIAGLVLCFPVPLCNLIVIKFHRK